MPDLAITSFNTDTTTRGFTGHEQIDPVGLIHMNGRVYDAELGRFLSADPHIQALDNLQNFNRYSYVLNNPLSYTDPTGFFFSKLFKAIGKAFSKIFKAIGRALKKLLRSPIIRAIIQIVACSFGGPAGCAVASGAMTAAGGGSVGDVLKAVAMSFVKMGVWKAVGDFLSPIAQGLKAVGDAATAAGRAAFALVKGVVHGVVGGALAVAQGGNFIQGFASNALGALAGELSQIAFGPNGSENGKFMRTAVAAISGCAGAALSGGKCANGAITAAFAHLYNDEMHASVGLRKSQLLRWFTKKVFGKPVSGGDIGIVVTAPNIKIGWNGVSLDGEYDIGLFSSIDVSHLSEETFDHSARLPLIGGIRGAGGWSTASTVKDMSGLSSYAGAGAGIHGGVTIGVGEKSGLEGVKAVGIELSLKSGVGVSAEVHHRSTFSIRNWKSY